MVVSVEGWWWRSSHHRVEEAKRNFHSLWGLVTHVNWLIFAWESTLKGLSMSAGHSRSLSAFFLESHHPSVWEILRAIYHLFWGLECPNSIPAEKETVKERGAFSTLETHPFHVLSIIKGFLDIFCRFSSLLSSHISRFLFCIQLKPCPLVCVWISCLQLSVLLVHIRVTI